jgi:GNAT superfamily N-acetyltransferase
MRGGCPVRSCSSSRRCASDVQPMQAANTEPCWQVSRVALAGRDESSVGSMWRPQAMQWIWVLAFFWVPLGPLPNISWRCFLVRRLGVLGMTVETVARYRQTERHGCWPLGHVHVWSEQQIVGQLEMIVRATTPPLGYVNLFYLAAEWRGLGIGGTLHQYMVEFMRNAGVALAQLSVSPSNARALAYYRKYSWRDLGPCPDDASVRLMELSIDGSP